MFNAKRNRTMSKAENYIRKNTYQFSNEDGFDYIPWLTPNQARKAVEIAREEIYEWLRANLCDYFDAPREDHDMCINDLKQAMKDE